MSPILVTYQEYCAIGFALSIVGLMYTMHNMFLAPHEREQNE